MHDPTWKAGPDCRPRLCRCGNLSSERADCPGCGNSVCGSCPHAIATDFGDTWCPSCVFHLALAMCGEENAPCVPDMHEAVRDRLNGRTLEDAENVEAWKLTAAVGLNVSEAAVYLACAEGRLAN